MAERWRVFLICTIQPIANALAGALHELGHEPVAVLAARRPPDDEQPPFLALTAASAPEGLDLLFALEGASWAGHFEDDEYGRVDWSQPARAIHNQVRAWHLTFGMSAVRAPVAELDAEEVVLLQTRLTDPGGDVRRVECGDGPICVVASEPV